MRAWEAAEKGATKSDCPSEYLFRCKLPRPRSRRDSQSRKDPGATLVPGSRRIVLFRGLNRDHVVPKVEFRPYKIVPVEGAVEGIAHALPNRSDGTGVDGTIVISARQENQP